MRWIPLLPKEGGLIQVDICVHPPFPTHSKHFSDNFGNLPFLAVFNFRGHFEGPPILAIITKSRISLMDIDKNFRHLLDPMTTDNNLGNAINGIFMLASFMVLFTVILFLFVICVYAGFRCRKYRGISLFGPTNISWHPGFSFAHQDPLSLRNVGLNMSVIESLPIFKYKARSFKDVLECTVCVSKFEDNEKALLLPNCKHSFHVDCIDMWFHSHSTCPICRTGARPIQRVGDNNTDEISMNVELISSGNREIRIDPGLEEGETSSQEAKTAVDEGPSTSGISSMPETAIDIPGRPESFSSEREVCLHGGSQSSKTALDSLKRILSRGGEGRVFPDAPQNHGIETEGQSQS